MLLLYLSDIKICYMKPVVVLHPFFNFFVCSFSLSTCKINVEFDARGDGSVIGISLSDGE